MDILTFAVNFCMDKIHSLDNITPCKAQRKRTKSEVSCTPSPVYVNPYKQLKMSSPDNPSKKAELPEEWATFSQDKKLDRLMEKLLSIDDSVNNILEEKKNQASPEELWLKISSLEGKNQRLEREVQKLSAKVEDLQWRDMRDNLVFTKIPEQGDDCEHLIMNFLQDEMLIPQEYIYSTHNLGGEIRIDVAHRMGRRSFKAPNPRPIVVKFVTRKGRDTVMKYVKNLKGKGFSVTDQLPPEMRERKMAQMDTLRKLRNDNQDKANNRIHFFKDKLLHNGQLVENTFEQNTLPKLNTIPMAYEDMFHSEPITIQGSVFQGHAMTILSIEEAVRARDALYQNPSAAAADHVMYAYRIDREEGIYETGNHDDGECMGSDVLVRCIQEAKIDNIFVSVTRIHSGPNLGNRRFQMIQQACRDVIQLF